MSTTKATLLKTIHQKCMDCSAYQIKKIELCPSSDCPLWPFRMGKDPFKTPRIMSEKQKQVLAAATEACWRKTPLLANEDSGQCTGQQIIPEAPATVKTYAPER